MSRARTNEREKNMLAAPGLEPTNEREKNMLAAPGLEPTAIWSKVHRSAN